MTQTVNTITIYMAERALPGIGCISHIHHNRRDTALVTIYSAVIAAR